jgi:hypothetical protein
MGEHVSAALSVGVTWHYLLIVGAGHLDRLGPLVEADGGHGYGWPVDEAVTLPLWALYLIGFGTPLSAFLGVLVSHWITHRANTQLEDRSKREETLRMLRWAAELAVSEDPRKALLGIKELQSLGASDLLDDSQQVFVDGAIEAAQAKGKQTLAIAGEDAQPVVLEDSGTIVLEGPDAGGAGGAT